MKIGTAKTLMAWCNQSPKVRERIVWDELPDAQKDAAVVAYLLDLGTPYAITIANRLNLPDCTENIKESAMRNTEYEIQYIVRQYNDSLDLRDAELSVIGDDCRLCETSLNKVFSTNQAEIDAGFSGTGREF